MSLVGINQPGYKPFFAQGQCHRVFGALPPTTNYLMGKEPFAASLLSDQPAV